MQIALSRRTAICQLVTEDYLTGVTPSGAVSHSCKFLMQKIGEVLLYWYYLSLIHEAVKQVNCQSKTGS